VEKMVIGLGALCAFAALSGCMTSEAGMTDPATPAVVGPAESTALGVAAETTIVMQTTATQVATSSSPVAPSPAVDILANMKKPCSAVAADAPKFVTPETK